MNSGNSLPVGIIGAGPVGLAAAAHLAMRNQPFIVFEAGDTIAANVLSWKHIKVFSQWKYNIDKAARQLLAREKWHCPPDEDLPTGEELYTLYLKPLAEIPSIKSALHLESRVLSIGRKNLDKIKTNGRHEVPFIIQVLCHSEITSYEVKAVIDTSGTWSSPNPIGAGGLYAEGEFENRSKIFYGIPDIFNQYSTRYKNKRVAVVGSGHSAINVILELDRLKAQYPETEIHWILRKKNIRDVYGGQEKDALEARGALGIKIERLIHEGRVNVYTPFLVERIENNEGRLSIMGTRHREKFALNLIDEIISNTGSRPDFSFLREVRLNIDHVLESVAELADLIDPNIHSCGTVRPHGEKELRHPDKNFYIAGSKSYGRAPTFLMATGYEQVRSIAAAIDGDVESALKVELDLPETGICSVDTGFESCCSPKTEQVEILKKTTPCCTPNNNTAVCCSPSQSIGENNGACCAQPEDGSACCNK